MTDPNNRPIAGLDVWRNVVSETAWDVHLIVRALVVLLAIVMMAVPAFADGLPCDVVHQRLDKASSVLGLGISIVVVPGKKCQPIWCQMTRLGTTK
jgi:hypothetical protein